MNISVKKTIEIGGYCPFRDKQVSIDVTYQKVSPLGDPHDYATVCGITCPSIEDCPDPSNCPVARQKTFW